MKIRHAALLSSCAMLLVHGRAHGQATSTITSTWVQPTTGTPTWNTPGNWNPATVPNNGNGSTYDVTIGSGAPTLDGNSFEINSLGITSSNAALVLDQAGSLTVDQNVTASGGLGLLNGSNLLVKGDLTSTGAITTGAYNISPPPNQITVLGTLTLAGGSNGGLQLNGTGDRVTAGTLVVQTPAFQNNLPAGTTLTATKEIDLSSGGGLNLFGAVQGLGNINTFGPGSFLGLNGETLSITPAFHQGTLNVGGNLALIGGTKLTIDGGLNITNEVTNGVTYTGHLDTSGGGNSLTVAGTLTNSGSFQLNTAGESATIGNLANTGFFTVSSGTSVNLTNQPLGITDIAAGSHMTVDGSFTAGGQSALAKLQSVEGSLILGGNTTLVDTPATGALAVASTGTVTQQNGSFTLNGGLNNQGIFQVGGAATITGALNNTGTVQVASGGNLNLSRNVTTLAAGGELDVYGTLSAGGKPGALDLQAVNGMLGFDNKQNQTITPASGTLNVTNALYVGGGTTLTVQGNLNNSAQQSATDPAFTGSQGLGVAAQGTLAVSGTLTNTGYLYGGTIKAGAIANSGVVIFDQNPPANIGFPTTLDVAGTYLQSGSKAETFLVNPGEVINAATIAVEGGSFQASQVNAQTLKIGSGANATLDATGNLSGTPAAASGTPATVTTIGSGGTLIDNGALTIATKTQINNAGSVTIGTGGVLSVPSLSVDGGILEGTGIIDGSVAVAGGTISPGSDPLTINGNFSLAGNGILAEGIGGAAAFSALSVSGAADLGGTLDLSLLGNFVPANQEQFVILQAAGGLTGAFTSIEGLNFGRNSLDSWNISYANNEVTLTADVPVAPVPEPGSAGMFTTALLALGIARLPRRRVRGKMDPGAGSGANSLFFRLWQRRCTDRASTDRDPA